MTTACGIGKIACFGSGGAAWSLVPALYEAGYVITQVFSRRLANAQALAEQVRAQAISSPADYRRNADLVLLAVPDDAIAAMLPIFRGDNALAAHLAGAVPLDVFGRDIARCGVLYPLQTFTRRQRIEVGDVPFFVEGNTTHSAEQLLNVARRISRRVCQMSSAERLRLHLAAVFASNFTNHCLSIAADLLLQSGIPADVVRPLVSETIRKALSAAHPRSVQSGPALRGDHATIHKHLALLQNNDTLRKIYLLLSESIGQEAGSVLG